MESGGIGEAGVIVVVVVAVAVIAVTGSVVQNDYYLTTMRQNAESLADSFTALPLSWYPFWTPQPIATIKRGF